MCALAFLIARATLAQAATADLLPAGGVTGTFVGATAAVHRGRCRFGNGVGERARRGRRGLRDTGWRSGGKPSRGGTRVSVSAEEAANRVDELRARLRDASYR
jgi:hypothetical protein